MNSIPNTDPSARRRAWPAALNDPALWAWLIVALLAIIPARAALHLLV
jgi:hypothetical protein